MKLLLDANISWRLTAVLKVILLRTGNISRKKAETIVLQAKAAIEELDANDYGLLEIL